MQAAIQKEELRHRKRGKGAWESEARQERVSRKVGRVVKDLGGSGGFKLALCVSGCQSRLPFGEMHTRGARHCRKQLKMRDELRRRGKRGHGAGGAGAQGGGRKQLRALGK